jgi:diguanylate cyclase (GGDEF)-like protein
VGRLGGDEFAALLTDTDADQARHVAGRLRLALSARISVSTGVATTCGKDLDTDVLYHRADERLYDAKRQLPKPSDEHALAS